MNPDLNVLSPAQRDVYEAVEQQGLNPVQAAERLGSTVGVVQAQLTRIRNKGIPIRGVGADERRPEPQSPQEVVKEAAAAGVAEYPVDESLQRAAERAAQGTDVHPMVLLGVTIQFVKLVGGRMTAHQLIEDVYEALRTFVADGTVPEEGATSPWPKDLETENAQLKAQMTAMQQELSDLRRTLERQAEREPSPTL